MQLLPEDRRAAGAALTWCCSNEVHSSSILYSCHTVGPAPPFALYPDDQISVEGVSGVGKLHVCMLIDCLHTSAHGLVAGGRHQLVSLESHRR
jgi:hypothetical protein